jgi:hypothetical protein
MWEIFSIVIVQLMKQKSFIVKLMGVIPVQENVIIVNFYIYIMSNKTVPIMRHKRSTPSPTPRKNPDKPKPGPKTVPVEPHRRSRPKN